MGKKYVFISYSSKDVVAAKRIATVLMNSGIEFWIAPDMIPPGSSYAAEIPRAIAECGVFVILITSFSQQSMWVEKELDYAVNNHKLIIPVNLSGVILSDKYRFYLNNVQMINYCDNSKIGMELLVKRIGDCFYEAKDEKDMLNTPGAIRARRKNAFLEEKKDRNSNTLLEERREAKRVQFRNTFSNDLAPIRCEMCGMILRDSDYNGGAYVCSKCNHHNMTAFGRVRELLDSKGPLTIDEIYYETGVERETIKQFVRDERLEVPAGSPTQFICEKCGTRIRTGYLCEKCKDQKKSHLKGSVSDGKAHYI